MISTSRGRTKTFTGCWTCRSRRVKCDEETPACQRCCRLGVACEGYGVRLNWVHLNSSNLLTEGEQQHDLENPNPGTNKAARRSLAKVSFSTIPRLPSPDIDSTLSKIDEWEPGHQHQPGQGGFAVFAMDDALPHHFFSRGNESEFDPERSPSPNTDASQNPGNTQTWTPSASSEDNAFPPPNSRSVDAVPAAETLLSLGTNCDHVEMPDRGNIAKETSPPPSHVPRHLDTLFMPSRQKRLIHHWITFTSRKLVLIDEPHNPCRIMMLPMALQGAMTRSEESNSNVAIFHALCASAASNLYNLSDSRNEQDRVLALNHEQQAISHLRNNLSKADSHQDHSFAMAIMACIAADAISGTTSRWRTHVIGGLAYLAKLQTRGLGEAVVAAFQKHMVSMAILCEIPVPDDLKSFLEDENSAESLEFTFPYYGVSRSFLRAYDRMSTLGIEASDLTPVMEKELDAFQLQQYLDYPSLPPREMLQPNQVQGLVLHHTAQVFYYARLVFFQRSIRRDDLESVQPLVELGIHEMEAIGRAGKGELGNMMLWPVIVLGAECDMARMQDRMRLWFKEQRKLGFKNLVVLEAMIESIWSARSTSAGSGRNVDWRDIITLPQFDVFRL